MATVKLPHPDTAPEDVSRFIREVQERYRVEFLPSMARALAGLPETIEAYKQVPKWVFGPGKLSRGRKELVATCVSALNACKY